MIYEIFGNFSKFPMFYVLIIGFLLNAIHVRSFRHHNAPLKIRNKTVENSSSRSSMIHGSQLVDIITAVAPILAGSIAGAIGNFTSSIYINLFDIPFLYVCIFKV